MKLILLLLLPSCIIGEVIRLQIPVFTFQPLKFAFSGTSFSSRNGNTPAAASTRVSSMMPATASFRSSSSGAQQPTTFTPGNTERQTPMLRTRLQNSQQMPVVATRSSVQQTSTLISTNRNNNNRNDISTRASFDDPEPVPSAGTVSTVRQNSLPGTTTSINRNIPTTRSPQQTTPGNVARQIKLLMSRSRSAAAEPSISTRTNSLSSSGISPNGPPCTTPDGESGVCVHVSSCNLFLPYMDLIDQPTVQSFFIERTCRITNMEVHVCCPRSPFAQGPTLRNAVPVIPTENECGFPSTNRLVNGEQVSVGSWPWLVTIGLPRTDNTFFHVCGGTLITRRHVLTAAHCFEPDSVRPRPTHVRLGEHHLESDNDGTMFQQRIIRGRRTFGYQSSIRRNDIELLQLDADVVFNDFVRPACLPINVNERESDFLGKEVTVVGWGKTATERSSGSLVPLQVDLPVTPIGSCSELYRSINVTVDNRNICAGGQGRDSCQGDSGGPLNYLNRDNGRYYVVGIVSHGLGCGTYPGVYTRVGAFINWILNIVR